MKPVSNTLTIATLLATARCGDVNAPALLNTPAPSGRIAFVAQDSTGGGHLYIADSVGAVPRQLESGQVWYSQPSWSPDGQRILVGRSDKAALVSGVFLYDVDGPSPPIRLAEGWNPAWSPDGRKIAFTSTGGRPWPDIGIHVMDADGRNVKRLTNPNDPLQCSVGSSAADHNPDWSPDGRSIVFQRHFHTSEVGYDCGLDGWGYFPNVYIMNADGSGVRRLRSLPDWQQTDSDPAWSPDGRFIAYAIWLDGLFVIDSEGTTQPARINPLTVGIPIEPSWSPDGKRLLFLSTAPPNNRLAIVDVETGVTQLLSFPTIQGNLFSPAWSR